MEQTLLTNFFLPGSVFIIMLGLGLALQLADFIRIFNYPKAIFIGITSQMILLPLIAFSIASFINIKPELAVGIMILSACPGGATSNLFSYLSNGDTALSITLTAISSALSVITIPLIINFGMVQFMHEGQVIHLPVIKTILQILVITIIPISLGMMVRFKKPNFAIKMEKAVKVASSIFLFAIIFGIIWNERERLPNFFRQVGFAIFALNIITMLIGYYGSKIGGLNLKQSITIALESGIQNGALGIVIAVSILNIPEMSIPSAVYGLLMYVSGGFMIWRFGKTNGVSTT